MQENKPKNQAGIATHNGDQAESLAARYAGINRAEAYPHIYKTFQDAATSGQEWRILDIGCGSGNDAYAFAQMGHNVTAVEPSDLRLIAQRDHAHPRVTYIDDTLPRLKNVTYSAIFNAVVMSAVVQYIHPSELAASLKRVKCNLKPGGLLFISYPNPPSRPHQFVLPPEKLLAVNQEVNCQAREEGTAPLLLARPIDSIADTGGRRGIDGQPVMFHNLTFQKSMTGIFTP